MRIIFFLSVLFCFIAHLHAVEDVKVNARYLVDHQSKRSWNEIQNKSFRAFKEDEKVVIGFNENAAVWVKIDIENLRKGSREFWLCFDNIHIDSFNVVNASPTILLGDRTKNTGPYLTSYTAPVQLKSWGKQTIILRLKKGISFFDFSFKLRGDDEMKFETRGTTFYVAFFCGFVFLLIIINGILFYSARKRIYVLYIIYSLLTSLYMLISTGFMKYYLVKEFLYFSEVRIYAGSLWFIVIGLFLGDLLELKKKDPFYHKAIQLSSIINLSTVALSFFFLFSEHRIVLKFLMTFNYVNFFFTIFFILWATVRQLKTNRYNAVYVLLAFAPLLIWTGFFMLYEFSLVDARLNFDWLALACVYEVALFGFVLGTNYYKAFQDNFEAQKELIATKERSIAMIVNAQIAERTGLASILHDQYSAGISNISHLVEVNQLELAKSQLNNLGESLRQFSHEIMPKSIEEGALLAGIKKQVEIMNQGRTSGIISFNSYDFPEIVDTTLSQSMYLITLEIIANARRHGHPEHIAVEFFAYPDQLMFHYFDDGQGFDEKATELGFGLETIKTRIESLKGTFDLMTAFEEGTEIHITIPKS